MCLEDMLGWDLDVVWTAMFETRRRPNLVVRDGVSVDTQADLLCLWVGWCIGDFEVPTEAVSFQLGAEIHGNFERHSDTCGVLGGMERWVVSVQRVEG